MKRTLNRIKTGLAALWVVIVSFFSKVFGQLIREETYCPDCEMQALYWVSPLYQVSAYIKTTQKLLIGIVFIIWLINFIKIKKTDDKTKKKKKIKRTIITISIILAIIILMSLVVRIIKNYNYNNA
jgi:quinol-cytochrome oxidoreductase complex cytochrome b subunit